MKNKTLVILAAGMGSRFGGMKQVEPVGPNGEFIIDYSIYSALRYGFNKVVFVIKEEYYDIFRNTIGKRIESKVPVFYAFQKLDDIPEGFSVPEGRVKPWGTAHALYSARKYINSNFGVITSDDFYGDDAFKELSLGLNSNDYVIVGYPLITTMSENGAVKRGVIISENNKVKEIIESSCEKVDEGVKCVPLDKNKKEFIVPDNQSVSMLMNGFTTEMIDKIGNCMKTAFENSKDDLINYEMLLPDIMDESIKEGKTINLIDTTSKWMGMTYKSDLDLVKDFIKGEIKKGTYPENLWK